MIKNRLSAIMGEQRIKMSDVAKRTGISYQTVHAVYHDKVTFLAFKTLDSLCQALNCQPGDILVYVPDPPPQDG